MVEWRRRSEKRDDPPPRCAHLWLIFGSSLNLFSTPEAILIPSIAPPQSPHLKHNHLKHRELYALHKQAAAGDCEVEKPNNKGAAEKAKWTAWKTKAGLR
jgi:hypothetical protein